MNKRRPKNVDEISWYWLRIHKTNSCWLWTAGKTDRGYGTVRFQGRTYRAHQVAYRLLISAVAPGLELDHLCKNKLCVNPSHLEPVTHRENILRGDAPSAKYAKRNRCKNGHLFSKQNTRRTKTHSGRICRACEKNNRIKHYEKSNREERNMYNRSYYAANRKYLLEQLRLRRQRSK